MLDTENKKEWLIAFGERVRQLRIEKDLTQEQLAIKVGYKSRTTINKIESGLRDVPTDVVTKLADVLQTTPAYLLGWDGTDLRSQVADMMMHMNPNQLQQMSDFAQFLMRKDKED